MCLYMCFALEHAYLPVSHYSFREIFDVKLYWFATETHRSQQQQRFEAMTASLFADLYAHNTPDEKLWNWNHHPIVNISINFAWIYLFDKLNPTQAINPPHQWLQIRHQVLWNIKGTKYWTMLLVGIDTLIVGMIVARIVILIAGVIVVRV